MIKSLKILITECSEKKLRKHFNEKYLVTEYHQNSFILCICEENSCTIETLNCFFQENKEKIRNLNYDDENKEDASYPELILQISVAENSSLIFDNQFIRNIIYTGIKIQIEE